MINEQIFDEVEQFVVDANLQSSSVWIVYVHELIYLPTGELFNLLSAYVRTLNDTNLFKLEWYKSI